MEFVSASEKDTQKIAKELATKILAREVGRVIALYGDLGSGKTTFTRFLAKHLGIREKILSPTFVIIKSFRLDARINADQTQINAEEIKYKNFVHIDTYRLKSPKDLTGLGLKNILNNKENIVAIEWPEKISKYLPKDVVKICFATMDEKIRKITINNI